MKKILKTWRWFFLILFFLFFSQKTILAKDYKVDYVVEYFLEEKEGKIQSPVSFKIKITNLRSDTYVQGFTLSFPKNFSVSQIKAFDDWGEIEPELSTNEDVVKISLKFKQPNIGRDTVNNFSLNFVQNNLFNINGNVWEVILPTVETDNDDSYQIVVNLPAGTDKKISIAKPKPTLISGQKIIWDNPKAKTIYAVFGDTQYYKTSLFYHLENTRPILVYTDIALPPETLYQKIYLEELEPKPTMVFQDDDGNFLARYLLKPLEKKTVHFQGIIAVYAQPRVEIKSIIKDDFEKQKKYLLTPTSFWQINNFEKYQDFTSLNSPFDIYNYVLNRLNYSYSLALKTKSRLGANLVLNQPNNAVCTEFTDLFIALAREKGIFSREIEGYGFTQDEKLRPLTLSSDVLHAWPEYFDKEKELWIPIDPTWEDTSGIDYFSSFDLNHIVFVIHGKDPQYPVSAGMYKLEDSRDVNIIPTAEKPKEKKAFQVFLHNLPKKINDKNQYQIKLTIVNQGNTYVWGVKTHFKSDLVNFSDNDFLIKSLAPLEKKEITLAINSKIKNQQKKGSIQLLINDHKEFDWPIIIMPYYYQLGLEAALIILVLGLMMIGFRLWVWKREKSV